MSDKEKVKEFYEDVVTHNKQDKIVDYIAENCVVVIGKQIFPMGVTGMQEHIKATKKTYPDYSMEIIKQYQDGEVVISEFIMTGTHKGEFMGIKPTNQVLSITGVDVDRVVDGKIVEHGGAANTFDTFFEKHLIRPV